MTLSRCGRVYQSFDEAYKAASARGFKTGREHVVTSCSVCADWHVLPKGQMIGKPKPYRPDPFPPPVVKLIDARDEHCQGCGSSGRLERHHRRAKGSGGSKARAHTQCVCNALRLCRRCHDWTHRNPAGARQIGFIVRQAVARPGSIAVLRYPLGASEYFAVDEFWATCSGEWVHSPGETED